MLAKIERKIACGERLSAEEGLYLLEVADERMIVAETYGSAIMIPSNLAREVINYVNIHDLVPWTDPIGYVCGIFNLGINMKFIGSSRDVPLASHMITHPTYQTEMNFRGEAFKSQERS